jgi:tyrosyl-tRNA synthetase
MAVTDPGYLIELASGMEARLSLGKKRHAILKGA